MKTSEFLELLLIKLQFFLYESCEFFKVAWRYYRNKSFRQQDLSLLKAYLWESPYTISKEYLMLRGEEDIYCYGETPLTSLDLISKECHLNSEDTVYELGSGRCRSCFWLASFIGCRVIGIEQIPFFIEKAQGVKEQFAVEKVVLHCGDFFEHHFEDATVIYLYGTCLEDGTIRKLIHKFSRLQKGAKIVTVSYPLTDYLDGSQRSHFKVIHAFKVSFPWGIGDVYLHVRT